MPVNDVYEVTTVCYGQGQNQLNVTHYRLSSITGIEPTMAQKAAKMGAVWSAVLKAMMANTVTYKGLKFSRVEPTPTAAIIDLSGAGVGAIAGDDLPPQISGLVSLRASSAPPRVRGRFYCPQTTEVHNDTLGVPTVPYQGLMSTVGTTLTSTSTVTPGPNQCTLVPVIYRRAPFHTWYDIDQAIVRLQWATQRRRSAINRGDAPAI